MICLRCAAVFPAHEQRCAECGGALVAATEGSVQHVVSVRVKAQLAALSQSDDPGIKAAFAQQVDGAIRQRLARWRTDGLLDDETFHKLDGVLPSPVPSESEHHVAPAPRVAPPVAPPRRLPPRPVAPPPRSPASHTVAAESAVQHGVALFEAHGTGVAAAAGGIAVLAALDAEPPPRRSSRWQTEVWPALYENIGWFIGAFLVLAGSVYGVREAWLALDNGARHALVAGAMFAYHAAFVALAALLARRAASVGRALGGIAAGLLPMSFAALGGLWQVSILAALPLTAILLVLTTITLRSIGARYALNPGALLIAYFPPLAAGLAAASGTDSVIISAFALAGPLCLWWSLNAPAVSQRRVLAAFSLYGYLSLEVTAAISGNGSWSGFLLRASLACAAASGAFSDLDWKLEWPRFAPALDVIALGGIATAALAAGTGAADHFTAIFIAAIAVYAFALAMPRHRAAVHFAVIAGAMAAGELGWFLGGTPGWAASSIAIAAAAGLCLTRSANERARPMLTRWVVVLALAGMVTALISDAAPRSWAALSCSVAVILAAVWTGRFDRRALHYLAIAGVTGLVLSVWQPRDSSVAMYVTFSGAALFAVAGIVLDRLASSHGFTLDAPTLRPYDDASLVALGVALGFGFVTGDAAMRIALVLAGAALLVRAVRDQSRLLTATGATLLMAALYLNLGGGPIVAAGIALGCMVFAVARGSAVVDVAPGRVFVGALNLPLSAPLRILWTDGFALASVLFAAWAISLVGLWVAAPVDAARLDMAIAVAMVAAAGFLAFGTPAMLSFNGRGRVATLAIAGVLLAGLSIVRRAGNIYEPITWARDLTIGGAILWSIAQWLTRTGPGISKRLGVEEGSQYQLVPHAGVGVMLLALLGHAFTVAMPDWVGVATLTPPPMLLGAALLMALMARSTRSAQVLGASIVLGICGVVLAASQRHLGGWPLVFDGRSWHRASRGIDALLDSDDTLQFLCERMLLSVAVCGAVLSAFGTTIHRNPETVGKSAGWLFFADSTHPRVTELERTLARWSEAAAILIVIAAWTQPSLTGATLGVLSGLVVVAGGFRSGWLIAALSLVTVLHAAAHLGNAIPPWIGAAIAGTALAIVALAPLVAGALRKRREQPTRTGTTATPWLRSEPTPRMVGDAHRVSLLFFAQAILYGFAAGGIADPVHAGWRTLAAAGFKFATDWLDSGPLAAALGIIALTTLVAGQRNHSSFWRSLTVFAASAAVLISIPALVVQMDAALAVRSPVALPRLVASFGWQLALAAGVLVFASQRWNGFMMGRSDASSKGVRVGRDVLLGLTGFLVVEAVLNENGTHVTPEMVWGLVAALVLVAVASAQAGWREQSGLHVYVVQLAAVGVYATFRRLLGRGLPPEADAIFALALGFALVGVTVLARRRDIPPVANATRRFAAILPLFIPFLLPHQASVSAALMAAASGALWGALGWVERNRGFGALAAGAVNLALFLVALASGLSGIEVYVAPLGLMTLAMGQIFATSLSPESKLIVRVIGGLLVYVPAAAQLALQVGNAQNGWYPVMFGGACLAGVALGMLLHIRAYLALGTGFLVLDVAASLVHAGLRDHRIGFAVLSLSGLTILGGMIFVTLQRAAVERRLRDWRERLAGWE